MIFILLRDFIQNNVDTVLKLDAVVMLNSFFLQSVEMNQKCFWSSCSCAVAGFR